MIKKKYKENLQEKYRSTERFDRIWDPVLQKHTHYEMEEKFLVSRIQIIEG